jgi:hypothetical protein
MFAIGFSFVEMEKQTGVACFFFCLYIYIYCRSLFYDTHLDEMHQSIFVSVSVIVVFSYLAVFPIVQEKRNMTCSLSLSFPIQHTHRQTHTHTHTIHTVTNNFSLTKHNTIPLVKHQSGVSHTSRNDLVTLAAFST